MARRQEEAVNGFAGGATQARRASEGLASAFASIPRLRFGLVCVFAIAAMVCVTSTARAEPLDEMSLDRWKKLREAERYQLNIAEKYYRAQDYKVAVTEYEKYLRLYEKSEAAPYAQLKWSLCQVQRRQQNTAIREGFQSILDYWPDTPDATAAAYYIGSTYRGMGELAKAKKAYAVVLAKHPNHIASVFARTDLAEIARVEKDDKTRAALWRELTFDVKRTPDTVGVCQEASRNLAVYYFSTGAFVEGKDALATTYTGESLPPQVMQHILIPISNLAAATATKPSGEKLADQTIAFLREQMPADVKDEAAKARAKLYWFYIADCYSYSLRHAEVPKVYDQMQKTFGMADDILGRLAGWFRSQSRRDEARATYARYANRPEGLNQVGQMYREEQKWDLAINTFREVAGLDQKNFATWEGQLAYTFRLAGKLDESINTYQGLIKRDAAHAGSWQWEIATTYRHFGKLKEAIASYRLCENAPQNYWEMAICHRALKQYGEALILYQQTIGSHPDWGPRSQLQIGYTYEEAGKPEFAIKGFQAVCSRYPKSGEASESHAHLENKYKISTGGGAKAGAEKE